MDNKNYMGILIQSLRKKEQILDQIVQLNIQQREELDDPNLDPDDFDQTMEKKAALIDQMEQLDEGFDQVYQRVREELADHKEQHRDVIAQMQELIKRLTDKSASIQAQEMRNKDLMTRKFQDVRRQVKEIRSSQKVVNQYYKNMMKSNYIDPQFLDNKK